MFFPILTTLWEAEFKFKILRSLCVPPWQEGELALAFSLALPGPQVARVCTLHCSIQASAATPSHPPPDTTSTMAAHCPQETTTRKQTAQALEMALVLFRLRSPGSYVLGSDSEWIPYIMGESEEGQSGARRAQESRPGPHLPNLRMKSTMSLIQHSVE